jgi:hypothetical protein
MKKMFATLLTLALSLVFALTACSTGPSKEQVKQAITEHLEHNKAWSIKAKRNNDEQNGRSEGKDRGPDNLKLGGELKVESVEVNQIGDYREQEKYWPVRARVKGKYQASFLVITADKDFDEELDFRLSKDDNGKWNAALKE